MIHKSFNTGWKPLVAGAALIIGLTVVAYLPAMHGGFVFDDYAFITGNRVVTASDGLYRTWFTTEAPHYYPLTWSLCWLEWRLWNGKATGYHVVNVLLHAVNAVLVWMVLRRLKVPGAWLAAVVFAIHPVNVATVAWISEQKNTLSMLFCALAILLYLRFDEQGGWRWYGLSLAAFFLALLSKTAVVMLPVVLLGCMWWRHGRLRGKDWLCSAPFFVLSLASGLVTIWFEYRDLRELTVRTGGFLSRLTAAGWAPWFYLSKALLPVDLTVIYPKWQIDASRLVSYLPGMILLGSFLVFWWKRKSWGQPLLFGLGYYVVMLFPVLGFFDQGFYQHSLVADHWQYYSIVGVIALAVAAGVAICRRLGERSKDAAGLISAAVLIVLGVAAWRRGEIYADEQTLWRDNIAKNPYAWLPHNNLGVALEQAGKVREAIKCYEQALRLKPDCAMAHNNLGIALGQMGKINDAIGHYEQALRLQTNFAEGHYNLGGILWQLGRSQEAMGHWEQALRLNPDSAKAHYNLGLALWSSGQTQKAMVHWEQALRINPNHVDAQNNLAWVLATLAPTEGGDPVRAVTLARRVCERTDNRMATYLDTLAVAYAATGRFSDAVATAGKAIDLARAARQPELVKEIGTRLQLYRDRRPYHPNP